MTFPWVAAFESFPCCPACKDCDRSRHNEPTTTMDLANALMDDELYDLTYTLLCIIGCCWTYPSSAAETHPASGTEAHLSSTAKNLLQSDIEAPLVVPADALHKFANRPPTAPAKALPGTPYTRRVSTPTVCMYSYKPYWLSLSVEVLHSWNDAHRRQRPISCVRRNWLMIRRV